MLILFVNPPWLRKKNNIWNVVGGVIPPIGLAQIASYIEAQGHNVKIIDAHAEGLDIVKFTERLKTIEEPSFIGITATTSIINRALETAKICKDVFPSAKIVLGGIHPSLFPDEMLKNQFVDFVVRKEGEKTFSDLIAGMDYSAIAGLSYKKDAAILHNEPQKEIIDINQLPMPAYHLLPMNKYRPALGSYQELPGIGMITSRGCPGRCTFCYGNYLGERVRMRTAQKIVDEIMYLQKNYGIKEIAFYDDTFTALKKNVIEFCNLLMQNKLKVSWTCFSRVDFIDLPLIELMKKSGCHQICYGIESGSEEILKTINKRISLEKAKAAVAITKKGKIESRCTFMIGNPGETRETIQKTIDLAIELNPDIALFNITTPYPGTEMFKWADKNGYLKTKDWSKYDLSCQVMEIPGLSGEEIMQFYRKAYNKFYLRFSYCIRQLGRLTTINNIKASIKAVQAIISVLAR